MYLAALEPEVIKERDVRLLFGGESDLTESESPSNEESFEANTKRPVFAGQEKYRMLKKLCYFSCCFFLRGVGRRRRYFFYARTLLRNHHFYRNLQYLTEYQPNNLL